MSSSSQCSPLLLSSSSLSQQQWSCYNNSVHKKRKIDDELVGKKGCTQQLSSPSSIEEIPSSSSPPSSSTSLCGCGGASMRNLTTTTTSEDNNNDEEYYTNNISEGETGGSSSTCRIVPKKRRKKKRRKKNGVKTKQQQSQQQHFSPPQQHCERQEENHNDIVHVDDDDEVGTSRGCGDPLSSSSPVVVIPTDVDAACTASTTVELNKQNKKRKHNNNNRNKKSDYSTTTNNCQQQQAAASSSSSTSSSSVRSSFPPPPPDCRSEQDIDDASKQSLAVVVSPDCRHRRSVVVHQERRHDFNNDHENNNDNSRPGGDLSSSWSFEGVNNNDGTSQQRCTESSSRITKEDVVASKCRATRSKSPNARRMNSTQQHDEKKNVNKRRDQMEPKSLSAQTTSKLKVTGNKTGERTKPSKVTERTKQNIVTTTGTRTSMRSCQSRSTIVKEYNDARCRCIELLTRYMKRVESCNVRYIKTDTDGGWKKWLHETTTQLLAIRIPGTKQTKKGLLLGGRQYREIFDHCRVAGVPCIFVTDSDNIVFIKKHKILAVALLRVDYKDIQPLLSYQIHLWRNILGVDVPIGDYTRKTAIQLLNMYPPADRKCKDNKAKAAAVVIVISGSSFIMEQLLNGKAKTKFTTVPRLVILRKSSFMSNLRLAKECYRVRIPCIWLFDRDYPEATTNGYVDAQHDDDARAFIRPTTANSTDQNDLLECLLSVIRVASLSSSSSLPSVAATGSQSAASSSGQKKKKTRDVHETGTTMMTLSTTLGKSAADHDERKGGRCADHSDAHDNDGDNNNDDNHNRCCKSTATNPILVGASSHDDVGNDHFEDDDSVEPVIDHDVDRSTASLSLSKLEHRPRVAIQQQQVQQRQQEEDEIRRCRKENRDHIVSFLCRLRGDKGLRFLSSNSKNWKKWIASAMFVAIRRQKQQQQQQHRSSSSPPQRRQQTPTEPPSSRSCRGGVGMTQESIEKVRQAAQKHRDEQSSVQEKVRRVGPGIDTITTTTTPSSSFYDEFPKRVVQHGIAHIYLDDSESLAVLGKKSLAVAVLCVKNNDNDEQDNDKNGSSHSNYAAIMRRCQLDAWRELLHVDDEHPPPVVRVILDLLRRKQQEKQPVQPQEQQLAMTTTTATVVESGTSNTCIPSTTEKETQHQLLHHPQQQEQQSSAVVVHGLSRILQHIDIVRLVVFVREYFFLSSSSSARHGSVLFLAKECHRRNIPMMWLSEKQQEDDVFSSKKSFSSNSSSTPSSVARGCSVGGESGASDSALLRNKVEDDGGDAAVCCALLHASTTMDDHDDFERLLGPLLTRGNNFIEEEFHNNGGELVVMEGLGRDGSSGVMLTTEWRNANEEENDDRRLIGSCLGNSRRKRQRLSRRKVSIDEVAVPNTSRHEDRNEAPSSSSAIASPLVQLEGSSEKCSSSFETFWNGVVGDDDDASCFENGTTATVATEGVDTILVEEKEAQGYDSNNQHETDNVPIQPIMGAALDATDGGRLQLPPSPPLPSPHVVDEPDVVLTHSSNANDGNAIGIIEELCVAAVRHRADVAHDTRDVDADDEPPQIADRVNMASDTAADVDGDGIEESSSSERLSELESETGPRGVVDLSMDDDDDDDDGKDETSQTTRGGSGVDDGDDDDRDVRPHDAMAEVDSPYFNPTIPLCPYELSGCCVNLNCKYQHLQCRRRPAKQHANTRNAIAAEEIL